MEDNNQENNGQQISSLDDSTFEKSDAGAMGKKAIKDLGNIASKQLKSKIKIIITTYVSSVVIIIAKILMCLFIFLTICGIIEWIKEKFEAKESPTIFMEALEVEDADTSKLISEFVQIKEDDDGNGYHFEFVDDFEEKVEKAAEKVGDKYGNLNDPELWKQFLITDFATQLPDLGGSGQVISDSSILNISYDNGSGFWWPIESLDGFLFIGDSITVGLNEFGNVDGKNLTFVGSTGSTPKQWLNNTTPSSGESTYSRLPEDSKSIKGISIMLGTNEISQYEDMKQLIEKIHEKYPNKHIYVQKILYQPNNDNSTGIDLYNAKIFEFCQENDYTTYIDATEDVELSDDGVHPTTKGYKKLAKNIKNEITSIKDNGGTSATLKPEDGQETTDEITEDEEDFINEAPKEFQGTIKIKRISPNKKPGELEQNAGIKTSELKYVDMDTFNKYINNGDEEALNTFTLSEDYSEIITAKWSYDEGLSFEANSGMDYRNLTASYAMPYEYPMMYHVTGKDALFSQRLMYLVLGSSVDIVLVDNVTTTKTVVTTTETVSDIKEGTTTSQIINTSTTYKEDVYTSTELGAVNSWWSKRTSTFNINSNGNISYEDGQMSQRNEEDKVITTQEKIEITTQNYNIDVSNTDFESNHEPFATIYNGSRAKSSTQENWLLEFMGENDRTANMVELTKYLLYKATGTDYGVTKFEDIDLLIWADSNIYGESSGIDGNIGIIYDFFLSKGLSGKAAAAIIGNIYVESGYDSKVVQSYAGNTSFNENYTKNVDNGTISEKDFAYNGPGGGGYGLAQWTSPGRKLGLYNYAKSKNGSIGDINIQLEFLWSELEKSYTSVLNYLKQNGENSISSLTEYYCWNFESPDRNYAHLSERKNTAENAYNMYIKNGTKVRCRK